MKAFLQKQWSLILAVNLLLGIALWFGFFTDVSLRGTISDIVFPPLVAIFALASLRAASGGKKIIRVLACLPSLVGGGLQALLTLILIIPPFTLGFLFAIDEISSEVKIQSIESPNKISIAEVYFRPVGAYASGSGRISIRVVNRLLPFVERDFYAGKTYIADEKTTEYVKWLDNETLYILEHEKTINTEKTKSETPFIAIVPMMIVGLVDQQINEFQLSKPLRSVPVYPHNKSNNDNTTVYGIGEEAFAHRVFFFHQTDLDLIYQWYLAELSTTPWEILEVIHTVKSGARTEYCIKAQRFDGESKVIFYWTIDDTQGESNSPIIRVTASTPFSHNIPCSP